MAVKKLQGVESVDVSLNEGNAKIQLSPRASVQLEEVRRAVNEQGFTPKEARVTAVGEVLSSDGKMQFKVRGSGEVFELALRADVQPGKDLLVTGIISPPEIGKGSGTIEITSAEPEAKARLKNRTSSASVQVSVRRGV